ncbi:RDD family protein [Bacillus sp. FJAT-49736]|uniref:RDD family protein n=1 Tax=Bacillus sp. FJAT-49736 TaxID=2833582 RepID=UPI001BC8D40D|nr:RDD family protein [Bacillus sp. FJAT-49736]MBS4173818.1 RDD family protein [Bacillus sp. FJAT-49736]
MSEFNQYDEMVLEQNDIGETVVKENLERDYYVAGFWMRFWAYLLDLIVIGSIDRLIVKPIFKILDISLQDSRMFSPMAIAAAITFYLYFVLMTKLTGQTIGKMVFGLKVISMKEPKPSWGTILFREGIGRYISTTILILYLIVAFTPKKQGLHDLFADTIVVHENLKKQLQPAH